MKGYKVWRNFREPRTGEVRKIRPLRTSHSMQSWQFAECSLRGRREHHQRDGGWAQWERIGVRNGVEEAKYVDRASSLATPFCALLQEIYEYRRSGSNRHGALAPPDFESGASTNSATPACPWSGAIIAWGMILSGCLARLTTDTSTTIILRQQGSLRTVFRGDPLTVLGP